MDNFAVKQSQNKQQRNLASYQVLMEEWRRHNLPNEDASLKLNLLMEEVGELARAFCKSEAKIKGTPEYWRSQEEDAVGDVILTLLAYCCLRGLDAQACLDATWREVSARDYQKYPETGKSNSLPIEPGVILVHGYSDD